MTDKILGKYKILKEESSSLKIGQYNNCDYRIEIVSKTPQSGQYSEIAKNINSVTHKNISNLKSKKIIQISILLIKILAKDIQH